MAPSRRGLLLMLGVVLTVALARPMSSAPLVVGSPEEDHGLLVRKDDDFWAAPPVRIQENGKAMTIVPVLIMGKGTDNLKIEFTTVELREDRDFFKKSRVNGLIAVGARNAENTAYTFSHYRIEWEGRQKYFVVPDFKGGVIRFSYQLAGRTLRLKHKGNEPPGAYPFNLAREYKRTKR